MSRVPAYGPLSARIVAVGEAPGQEEVSKGRPFVGPAGKKLRMWFQEVGIDPEEVFYTNICKYRPPENKLEKWFLDEGLPTTPVQEGILELVEELSEVRPNVVLTLGNFALWALTGKTRWVDEVRSGKRIRGFMGIQNWRGSILPATLVEGLKVVPTFHPSYIQREGMKDHGTFKADLTRARHESAFPDIRWPVRTVYVASKEPREQTGYNGQGEPEFHPSDTTRDELRDRLLARPDIPLTLDIEYVGSKLLCVGLTNERESSVVVPTGSLSDILYLKSIVDEAKSFNAQNAMFDASILEWHYQMPIMERVVFDTMVCAYVANVELPKGLDYLTSIYTDQPFYKDIVEWERIKKGLQDLDTLYAYNGIDAWVQHEVMEEQTKHELCDEDTRRNFIFLMRMLLPLWKMSKRGIRIDLELMHYAKEELKSEASVKQLELQIIAGSSQLINVKSGPQVAALLFEKLGLPVLKQNKTGPATDDKTLAELALKADGEPLKAIQLIRQIRKARDLQSKFFNVGFDEDGRMRGTYNPTKTVTGRLSSMKFWPSGKGTNQQNIPRDKRARRAFVADPKKVFGYADLEKAESLVVAHLTGDAMMLFDHSPGQNAHRNLGARLFGKPSEELNEDEYYLSKQTRHSGNYLEGPITFMRNVNQKADQTGVSVTRKEADFFIYTYRELHTGLKPWWNSTDRELRKGRTLWNLVGFPRTFYGHLGSILPEAVAFKPQSTVGQVLNMSFLTLEGIPSPYLEKRGFWKEVSHIWEELHDCGFDLLQQIHDAVGFQVWERDVERAVPLIRRALQIPLLNPRTYEDFIIPVEVLLDLNPEHLRTGKSNWGDVKPYTKDIL